ncbi:MAG: hypothetical protein AABX50_01750 [Nanoarchaeota archaeon]
MGFLGFGKNKEKKSLEQLAREAVIARGIKIVDSPPQGDYYPFNVTGVGESEKDYKGALEDFKKSLDRETPQYVSSLIEEDLVSLIGIQGKKQKRVHAIGYRFNSPRPRNKHKNI